MFQSERVKDSLETYLFMLLVVIVLFFSIYNLDSYFEGTEQSGNWYDEGIFLQAPMNLIKYGKYAILTQQGFKEFDFYLTTGPTVLLPIALSFKIFGIGLLQARLLDTKNSLQMRQDSGCNRCHHGRIKKCINLRGHDPQGFSQRAGKGVVRNTSRQARAKHSFIQFGEKDGDLDAQLG